MNIRIIATKTCSHRPELEKQLQEAELQYKLLYFEDHPELIETYKLKTSPLLVVDHKIVSVGMPEQNQIIELKKQIIMKYYIEKTTEYTFDEAIEKVTDELKKEGFGVLSEINIHEQLKEKLDVDFRKYKILGACSPAKAYEALQFENRIGTMLPCNVIVQELDNGKVEVAAVNPVASMMAVNKQGLIEVATEIKEKLQRVINAV